MDLLYVMETKYMVILPVWTLCVTVAFNAKIHFTISLIVCVSGVKFVKSVEGYSNSIKPSHFLNFFLGEAGKGTLMEERKLCNEETTLWWIRHPHIVRSGSQELSTYNWRSIHIPPNKFS